MPRQTRFRDELVDPTAYIAPTAVVLGDVTLGPQSSVWFQAVVRGDTEAIRIGARTNIQDGAVLHADPGFPCLLGEQVTVGHRAIVHGANIADRVLVGMGAIVMNGARVGSESIIGAGAVLAERAEIPPRSLVLGVPGRIVRTITDDEAARIVRTAENYVEASGEYR